LEELQQRVDKWIGGEIPFSDDDRLLSEKTGDVMRLGLIDKPFYTVNFVFYNLGFSVIQDQNDISYIVNVVGFEDGQGQRFTFLFHNGKLTDPYAIIILNQIEGRRVNRGTDSTSNQLTPYEFVQQAEDMTFRVNNAITWFRSRGETEDEGINYANQYLSDAQTTVEAFSAFLECDDCSVENVSPVLKKYINTVPVEFDKTIPYLRIYYVTYW